MKHQVRINLSLNQNKILLILFFLGVIQKAVHGQIGLKIGITASGLYYPAGPPIPYKDYDVDLRPYVGYDIELVQAKPQKPLLSPYVSVYYHLQMTEKFSFRPEINFTQRGVDFSQSDFEKIIYKIKINYLDIPVSLQYRFINKEHTQAHVYMGAYGAYQLSTRKMVGVQQKTPNRIPLNSVKDIAGGVLVGMDYLFNIKNEIILLDLRFFLGLTDILEEPENQPKLYFETHKTKVTGLNLSVGYEF